MTSCARSSVRPDLLLVLGAAEDRLHLVAGRDDPEGPVIEACQEWRARGRILDCLAPAVENMLRLLGGVERLAKVACVRGPGSFSGIRIALATAAGLLAGAGVPQAGLDHLEVLALSAPELSEGTLAILTHARRGLVYLRCFDLPGRAPLGPVRSLTAQAAAEALSLLPGPVHGLGSGLRRNAEVLLAQGSPILPLPAEFDAPSPEALLQAAVLADYAMRPLDPHYVRPSDAEENLAQLAALRGLSEEEGRILIDKARHEADDAILPSREKI